jgi:CIC family chloride channel protein
MTMTFLALESTQNFAVTMAVLAASITAALTVRRLFGYSFATWRFHLRGEAIRSAVDIGWVNDLTVGRMMRQVPDIARQDMTLEAFRREFPLGSRQYVIAVDDAGRYAGIVYPAEAVALNEPAALVADLLHHADHYLMPGMTVKEAITAFEKAEADALAVLDGPISRRVRGVLTEPYALRRYNEELERRRRELSGE